MQLMAFLGGFISQLTSGLWIERFGFIAPVWLMLACYSVAALWVIFLVPENCVRVTNEKNRFFELNHLKRLVNVFKVPRTGGSRRMLLLLMFVGAICTFTDEGLTGVKTLFIIKSPLCFSPSLVGYFLAYTMLIFGLGAAVGVKLFRTFFSEKITGGIGVVSQMIGIAFFAFSNRTWLAFLGEYRISMALFEECKSQSLPKDTSDRFLLYLNQKVVADYLSKSAINMADVFENWLYLIMLFIAS